MPSTFSVRPSSCETARATKREIRARSGTSDRTLEKASAEATRPRRSPCALCSARRRKADSLVRPVRALLHRVGDRRQGSASGASFTSRPWSRRAAARGAASRAPDRRGEGLARRILAVVEEDAPRLAGQRLAPAQQLVAVGVRREPLHLHDLRRHRRRAGRGSRSSGRRRAAPGRACRRPDSRRRRRRSRLREAAREMVDDAPAGRHAARGDDDRRLAALVERLRLLDRVAAAEAVDGERVGVGLEQRLGILVELRRRLAVDLGGADRHRAVEEDGVGIDAAGERQLREVEEEILRPAEREGRNDHEPPRAKVRRMISARCGPGFSSGWIAVAVGRLEDQGVGGRGRRLGVAQDRRVVAPDVAREEPALASAERRSWRRSRPRRRRADGRRGRSGW